MSTTTFDPFRQLDRLLTEGLRGASAASAVMPMDLFRSGESFFAQFDLPGVDPGSIDIDVEDRTLTVRAERPAGGRDDAQWLSRERATGTVARQLSLGRGLALDRIEADYRDGVLSLRIPVAEEAKPRKISVSHAGSPTSIGSRSESTDTRASSATMSEDDADGRRSA
ncbi:HSP20 family protein [Terracoccus luteus]|uniref:HSP20 family protein n=1 Tax=Terracoccus luteus TaxID=53356 RepID=A0A495Y496_9MICO|nr:Hsp20/alpha crystallin family protein [Terracoccus luteus]RKT79308.1 HSP20 family protein [Terracoccus luteus]